MSAIREGDTVRVLVDYSRGGCPDVKGEVGVATKMTVPHDRYEFMVNKNYYKAEDLERLVVDEDTLPLDEATEALIHAYKVWHRALEQAEYEVDVEIFTESIQEIETERLK